MESKIEDAKNEVMRKLGRNVLFYQQFEIMLKQLIIMGNFSGYSSDLEDNLKSKAKTVRKKTLGQVAGQFHDQTYSEKEMPEIDELEKQEIHISFSCRIGGDEDFYKERKQILASIVAERNKIIHHFLLNYDLNSIDGLLEAEECLDLQHSKLLPESNMIKKMLGDVRELYKKGLEELLQKQLKINDLSQEDIVKYLYEITELASRSDGWTLLNHAGQLIQQNAHEEMKKLNTQYGYKKLKELILATELFDIKEEPTDKGGVRVLYRLKNGLRYE